MKRYLADDRPNYDPVKTQLRRAAPDLRSLRGPVDEALDAADDLPLPPPPARNRRGSWREYPNGHSNTPRIVVRFLRSRAGRPWNDVWREICETYPAGHKVRELVASEVEHGHVATGGTITIPGRYYCCVLTAPYAVDTLVIDQRGVLRYFPRTLGRRKLRQGLPFTAVRAGELCVLRRETGHYQFSPSTGALPLVDQGSPFPQLPDNCSPRARLAALTVMGYERFVDQTGAEFYVLRRAMRRLSADALKRLQARSQVAGEVWARLSPPSIVFRRGRWFGW